MKKSGKKKFRDISLTDERIIYLNGEINEEKAKDTIEQLLKYDLVNNKDITIFINSGGGSVSAGLAIFEIMNYIKSDIKTICIGKCCSMASILLLNGTKGKRYIGKNSEIMIHEVSSFAMGKITQMSDDVKHTKTTNDKILKIIADKTNISIHQLKSRVINKDHWMSAKEAIKYGFVDKILW